MYGYGIAQHIKERRSRGEEWQGEAKEAQSSEVNRKGKEWQRNDRESGVKALHGVESDRKAAHCSAEAEKGEASSSYGEA